MSIRDLCFFLSQIVFIPPFLAAASLSDKPLKFRHYVGYTLISPFFVYVYSFLFYGIITRLIGSLYDYDRFRNLASYADVLALIFSFFTALFFSFPGRGKKRLLRFYVYTCFYMSSMVFTEVYTGSAAALLLGLGVPCLFALLMYLLLVKPLKDIVRSIDYFHGAILFFPIAAELLVLRFLLGLLSVQDLSLRRYDTFLNVYQTLFGYVVHCFIFASAELVKRDIHSIRQIENNRIQVVEANERIRRLSIDILLALAATIDAKDSYTNGHSARVAEYSERIARKLGYDEAYIITVRKAALLHDIGKIGIPDEIIRKTSSLTGEEYDLIKSHPRKGYEILSKIEEMPELRLGALYHHERWDGRGYPAGISGDQIPQIARIISVSDAYDAMTSNRSYRNALPADKVRSEIENGIGSQFDPVAARALLEIIDSGFSPLYQSSHT